MGLWASVLSAEAGGGAVRLMKTRIRLLAKPKSMSSIINATQRNQRYG
jgi:hypothetical protein